MKRIFLTREAGIRRRARAEDDAFKVKVRGCRGVFHEYAESLWIRLSEASDNRGDPKQCTG